MWSAISQILSEKFGSATIVSRKKLQRGDVHPAWHIRFGERDVFVKSNQREMRELFSWEADQLALLARTHTVNVPEVYGVGEDKEHSFLLLSWHDALPLDAQAGHHLGAQLARLHQWSDQPQFGLDFDNNITTTPQPNGWLKRWSVFFAEQRIGWQLQLAEEKGIRYGNADLIVQCVQALLASHHPQPSLLHGDLWPANCAGGAHGPWVCDPACYWGDRECDLAMLPRFHDLPVAAIMAGYQSVNPLPEGYARRQTVYQLYYLLNRANVFGGEWLDAAQCAIGDLLDAEPLGERQARPA
ncbi:fructosamine kinase family protein [Pantoea sp. 1.19]|uniref:fructosamine kinase family protein n=1 Tax=Pantoea sp. 1.19 TaxID=1925589 RepID=UPI000948F4D1|nr:fructosamine kinase family protein [Pantoea sp. 1.19]